MGGANLNIASAGSTPLILAARKGKVQVISVLIDRGAVPTQRDAKGRTALHYATFSHHSGVINELLKHVVVVGTVDKKGDTALSIALFTRHMQVVEKLRKHDPVAAQDAWERFKRKRIAHQFHMKKTVKLSAQDLFPMRLEGAWSMAWLHKMSKVRMNGLSNQESHELSEMLAFASTRPSARNIFAASKN